MKVCLDISSMHPQSATRGIGAYAKNLALSIEKYTDVSIRVMEKEERGGFDLIHYPFFDFFNTTLPLIKKTPTIVTIHDCIPLLFPEHYPPGIKGNLSKFIQSLSLKGVSAVITDSLSSKKDIGVLLKIPSEKIFVVPLAPSAVFKKIDKKGLEITRDKYNLPPEFALYIGSVNWNKNLLNMAEGCIRANMPLVLLGKDFENRENLNHPELESFKLFLRGFSDNPLIKILGFVKEEELVDIINLASVSLLPSFYEGFGLPILESQLCGTPVITSVTSSMPEVAGDGAYFIDPNNIDDICAAIKKVKTERIRTELINRGFENSKKFSWRKTAEETVKIYKGIKNKW